MDKQRVGGTVLIKSNSMSSKINFYLNLNFQTSLLEKKRNDLYYLKPFQQSFQHIVYMLFLCNLGPCRGSQVLCQMWLNFLFETFKFTFLLPQRNDNIMIKCRIYSTVLF